MNTRNSKTSFTRDEFDCIIELVRKLEQAELLEQKKIRAKIRKIGLYWSEVTNLPYTVSNVNKFLENGTLNIIGSASVRKQVSLVPTEAKDNNTLIQDKKKTQRDEGYVVDLCDKVLGQEAKRQYRFNFLRGDTGYSLPVDAYYPELDLVIEYHESQHTEDTPFFDKKRTVSGVSRGEQRRIYDKRRQEVLPEHGLKLVIISYKEFGESKKLKRNPEADLKIIRKILVTEGVIQ